MRTSAILMIVALFGAVALLGTSSSAAAADSTGQSGQASVIQTSAGKKHHKHKHKHHKKVTTTSLTQSV